MEFGSWSSDSVDALRRKRLAIGYGIGVALFGVIAFIVSVTSAKVAEEAEEEVLEVKLASTPEPEPEPEPEPQPTPQPQAPRPGGPRVPKLTPPKEVPQDKPAETEAKPQPEGEGDPYASGTQGGGGSAKAAVVEPVAPPPKPPPAPVKPSGPIRVTENVTPPQCSIPTPSYPSAAKAAGIEGTVIVKYVVSASGAITNATVVRGPPELHEAASSAFKGVKCKPAVLDGSPVSVFRVARIPFRIRT